MDGLEKIGDNGFTKPTRNSERYADYQAMLQLRQLSYSTEEIMRHMNVSKKYLFDIEDEFDPPQED